MNLYRETVAGRLKLGYKQAPLGSGPPPDGIAAALAMPNPTYALNQAAVGAGYLSEAGRCYVSRTGVTFYVNPDPKKLPIRRATFHGKVWGPYSGTQNPTWQLWWATSSYQVGGNYWCTPLIAPASATIGAKAYGTDEEIEIELIDTEDYCVPGENYITGWKDHCCLALVMYNEAAAEPTGPYDWYLTFNGGIWIDLYYRNDTRIVVPLVPGPAQARGGKPGSGHRTRL